MNLYPLICLLSDGKFYSGTSLGKSLGVSRTAIWKQIQQLEKLGLKVNTQKSLGYALASSLDLLDPNLIQQQLEQQSSCFNFELVPVIASTNQELKQRFSEGVQIDKQLLVAELQTAGQGRRGKKWVTSYAQALTFSLAWRFTGGVESLQGISLAVGVVVKQVLESFGIEGVQLKWPNDVYLNGAKVAGILIEVMGDFTGECNLVLGIGLNIAKPTASHEIDQAFAYLNDVKTKQSNFNRTSLFVALTQALENLLNSYAEKGFAAYADAWNQAHIWQQQTVFLIQGNKQQEVVLGGVNKRGELEVTYQDASTAYISGGEISLRKKV